VILAIGNPAALTGALTRVGGITAQLEATYAAEVEVTPLDSVVVPATERILVPTLGKPRP
jgi:uncharacterized protein YlxW (UPF0749 family)